MVLDPQHAEANQAGISAHDQLAAFYQYRPPYFPEFFEKLKSEINLRPDAAVLDLCCGRGEVAEKISGYVRKVCAVDGSSEMLARAILRDNIEYQQANVNLGSLPLAERFEYITIGTAVHWIRDYALMAIIESNLQTSGKVIILHRKLQPEGMELESALRSLNSAFGKGDSSPALSGKAKLEECGFRATRQIDFVKKIAFSLDYLYMHNLSSAYGGFYQRIIQEKNNYKEQLMNAARPFMRNDRLFGHLINWAIIYERG